MTDKGEGCEVGLTAAELAALNEAADAQLWAEMEKEAAAGANPLGSLHSPK